MKFSSLFICILGSLPLHTFAQKNDVPDFNRTLQLEERSDTTANVSFGDFDGDGHLDIVLVKGRHWPIVDRILLGDGKVARAYLSPAFSIWSLRVLVHELGKLQIKK